MMAVSEGRMNEAKDILIQCDRTFRTVKMNSPMRRLEMAVAKRSGKFMGNRKRNRNSRNFDDSTIEIGEVRCKMVGNVMEIEREVTA
jgi:hypothetical protein